jgi:N-acetyl-gamma-glutamyl-phosphate reductase
MKRVAVIGGAGYTGGALIERILRHPGLRLIGVGSRSFAGQPVSNAHPSLRGAVDLTFSDRNDETVDGADAVFLAVDHGAGMGVVDELLRFGYSGIIVDLSADFRLKDPSTYARWYGREHMRPDLLHDAFYGLPEIAGEPPAGTRLIANPGCFATAISLATFPVARNVPAAVFAVTALTGASGSGVKPGPGTHFPTRDGNIRAYNVMRHRHQAEIELLLEPSARVAFTPVSGPWTYGIWGTATVGVPAGTDEADVSDWFEEAFGSWRLVRLSPGTLPELRHVVHTPFCDLGWVLRGESLVVGFALDNLLKGAASQALQNLNLLTGVEDWTGLVPGNDTAAHRTPQRTGEAPL